MYSVEISAENSQGMGPLSDPVSIRTLEDGEHVLRMSEQVLLFL